MNVRCGICLEDITANIWATQCGHLYCEECATFNFTRSNPACAICRREHAFEALVRLYPDFDTDNRAGGSTARAGDKQSRRVDALLGAAMGGCLDLLEHGCEDSQRTEIVLSRVDNLLNALPNDAVHPELQHSLQTLAALLMQIRSKIPTAQRLIALELECESYRGEAHGLKSQLTDAIRQRDENRKKLKEEHKARRNAWAAQKSHLQAQLQEATGQLAAERGKVERAELAKEKAEAEKRQAMFSSMRYKKKYYALKAQISALSKFKASGGESDDSLEVVA
ncbi:hypothetical protein OBBRIDRAFT_797917 [Obba rivulosa]|uniref:RING-type domain-containing protein n=1 Tax=Obba rivulosa TaxID=1052685 RepID=A0A8E2AUQ3_9APHY|nr:hypothetical protein OBBRIDRAFT_797917 [Obba rivulosa]